MKSSKIVVVTLAMASSCFAQDADTISDVAKEVAANIGKVSSFSATVETREEAADGAGQVTTSDLKVSRLYGWKLVNTDGPQPYTAVTDFETFYQFFPQDRQVLKTVADSPEIKAMLTKPVTDMNPLKLLDQGSLCLVGKDTVAGETVYHVKGTTESQLMPGGPDVKRTLSAWVSVEDGLPRKTVESVGMSTGTTLYKNVKVNPELKPEDFKFTPPEGVSVISTNEQMRRLETQMQKPESGASTPASQ